MVRFTRGRLGPTHPWTRFAFWKRPKAKCEFVAELFVCFMYLIHAIHVAYLSFSPIHYFLSYDTGLKNTQNKKIHRLNSLLGENTYLTGDKLTVADVAVASYLLYVVQFFPDIDLLTWPNMVRYMKDCASREAYAKAYGEPVQTFLLDKLEAMGTSSTEKKLFGMF